MDTQASEIVAPGFCLPLLTCRRQVFVALGQDQINGVIASKTLAPRLESLRQELNRTALRFNSCRKLSNRGARVFEAITPFIWSCPSATNTCRRHVRRGKQKPGATISDAWVSIIASDDRCVARRRRFAHVLCTGHPLWHCM